MQNFFCLKWSEFYEQNEKPFVCASCYALQYKKWVSFNCRESN